MAYKKWIIADFDKEQVSVLSEKFNIDPFIALMLVSREINDDKEVSAFLDSSCNLSDPFLLADMDKAAARIEQAIDYGEKITVFGDYDCDGVTSAVLLYSFLSNMGADVDYYIPSRLDEGYGMNKSAIDKICESGTKLIVTVDNGISAVEEAEYIYSLGMQLVVTDHHQIGETLPRAEAVVNPHREDNKIGFRDFAGVGVAFKLACAVYGDTEDMLYQFADIAAIGTIADVVPLIGENRAIVKAGLKMINSYSRIGINALRKAAGIYDSELSSADIAFRISPRINAAGRVDNARRAAELLLCENEEEAALRAEQINIDNSHRQELEHNILDDVRLQLAENPEIAQNRVIVVSGKGYHKGIIGIVAARVLEEYGKPVIIISEADDETAVGSARSIDGFNIFEAVSACSDMLTNSGGHPKAAGIGLRTADIDTFRKQINEYALAHYPVMPVQSIRVDFRISPNYLNAELADMLKVIEPCGENNPSALFALMNIKINSVNSIGEGRHISLDCEKNGRRLRIVKFGCSAQDFPFSGGDSIDAVIRVSKNIYNGRESLSLYAEDIKRHGNDDEKYFSEKNEYELFVLGRNHSASVFPSREKCSVVYRFLRSRGKWHYGFDELYFSLHSELTYGQLKFALRAFEESGLTEYDNNDIVVCNITAKVDLMNTPVMKELKGRLNLE